MEKQIAVNERIRGEWVLYNIINRYGDTKVRKITREDLARLISNPPYKPIYKKIRGKLRLLFVPEKKLMILLRGILEVILYDFDVSVFAHGGVLKRSVVTNAQPHLGSSAFFKIDFKNYYPSITRRMVVDNLRDLFEKSLSFGFFRNCGLVDFKIARALANTIGGLVTFRNVLPQGAPTSSYLQNLIFRQLDQEIAELSREHNVNYTRFVDDMVFSTIGAAIPIEFRKNLIDLIKKRIGYSLKFNRKKIYYKTGQGRLPVITGITLSMGDNVPRLSLPRKQIERYRSILHNASLGMLSREKAWGIVGWVKMTLGKFPIRLKGPFLKFLGNCYPDSWDKKLDRYKDML